MPVTCIVILDLRAIIIITKCDVVIFKFSVAYFDARPQFRIAI